MSNVLTNNTFCSDGSETILRNIKVKQKILTKKEIEDVYEIERCKQFIKDNSFKKVALQFPDEDLINSHYVVDCIAKSTNADLFILGDTSYGSCPRISSPRYTADRCCVDEVAAEHGDADCLLHFGSACLSSTTRLPVCYVFAKRTLHDAPATLASALAATLKPFSRPLLLFVDLAYHHRLDEIAECLRQYYPGLLVPEVVSTSADSGNSRRMDEGSPCPMTYDPSDDSSRDAEINSSARIDVTSPPRPATATIFGRTFRGDIDAAVAVIYVGGRPECSSLATHLAMRFASNSTPVVTFDAETGSARLESSRVNRTLMRRYYLVEKVKDAHIIGILISTLVVKDYLKMIDRLKLLIKRAGKKSYLISVGKLNAAKLANFSDIEIFVTISCIETSLVDCADLYRPVVTPYEVEVALNANQTWDTNYCSEFARLLPGGNRHVEVKVDTDTVDVSLVTGNIRQFGASRNSVDCGESCDATSAVAVRNDYTIAVNAAEFLTTRIFRGLEPKYGQTEVSKAVEGGTGIAMGYEGEGSSDTATELQQVLSSTDLQ